MRNLEKEVLSVVIVGYGHIGKLHHKIIDENPNYQLVGIVENSLIYSELPVFKTIKECNTQLPAVDLYIIATPNYKHYKQAKELLILKKNILVEKPIVLQEQQLLELLELAILNKVRLFSSLQLRFSPVVQYVKMLLNQNKLGNLLLISIECLWNRNNEYYKKSNWHGSKEKDGGILFTQFSHFIDILHYFLNDTVELISNNSHNFTHLNSTEFADSGILQFKSNNTLGSMIYTVATYEKNFESSITLIGEEGTLKIGGQYMNSLLHHNIKNSKPIELLSEHHNFHKDLYLEIYSSLHQNSPSIVDAQHSLKMIDFIEKASQ